jgi:tetratricopeptide (TPR) repeat protein
VLKENARDNDALIMRGNLALARGDAPSAITDLRSVLRDQPSSVPVMRALARAHAQNGELAMAEETLRNAVQVNPKDVEVRMDLARLLTQSGKLDQARPLLEQIAKEQPSNIAVQETLFRVQAAQKDFKTARATAIEIQEAHPDMPMGYYLAGIVDDEETKTAAAIENYERALKIQPKSAEALTALVRLELARKQPQQAMARLDRALVADPDNVIASSLRAEILLSQGKTDEAIATYEAITKKQPKWFLPYRGMAMAYRVQKNDDAAIATLRRGIENTGGETSLFLDLSSTYERRGDLNAAIANYEAWLLRDPKSIVAANNLAMLLVTTDNSKKNLERAQQLSAQLSRSDDAAILDTRGWVDYKSGNYRQAVQLLERATEKSSASPVLKYHLGMAQVANGDPQAARKNLEAALGSGKPFRGAEEAQSTLNTIKEAG